MRRATTLLLLSSLLLGGCASSTGAVDRALVEAGRQRRREQPPPTAEELRREIDSFLDNELPLMQKKADAALAKELKTWRVVFLGSGALGLVGATSGSISDSEGAAQAVVTGVGIAGMVAGAIAYYVRTPEVRACKAYLESARQDVVAFRKNGLPPGDGPVGEATWHAWVDRVAAIRGHEGCARVR